MVTTKPCCWVECKTYSRYAQKWPKSLRELEAPGMKVFIPFPKPTQDMAKCKRWLVACSRDFFSLNITRNVYKFVLSTGQQKRVQQPNSLIRESYASVNSKCALPPPPPGLTPGNLPFFSYGWQIPGGGGT